MYNFLFGKKQDGPQKTSSEGSTGHIHKIENIKIKDPNTERNTKTGASPLDSMRNCNMKHLENLDPGLVKATAFESKLSTKLNLESLDPNNMLPLRNVNDGLTACKVCARHFAPQRIGIHQSICERMTQRDSQNERHRPKSRTSKPASIITQGAKTRHRLVVRPQTVEPISSLHKQSRPLSPVSKTVPIVAKPRPQTAKPALNDSAFMKNLQLNTEQAGTSKNKRPLSAFPSIFPKRLCKPKEEIDERVPCPTCQRKFNKTSAAHHIPWCKQQASLIKPPKPQPRRKYVVPKLRIATTDAPAPRQKLEQKTLLACNTPKIQANKPCKVWSPNTDNSKSVSKNTSRSPSRKGQLTATESKLAGSGRPGTQATSLPQTQLRKHNTSSYSRSTNSHNTQSSTSPAIQRYY